MMPVARVVLAVVVSAVLVAPAWSLARLLLGADEAERAPFWRLLWAIGLALTAYLSVVNLAGRALHDSTVVATAYVFLNLGVAVVLRVRSPALTEWGSLIRSWRTWIGLPALAVAVGLPQILLAVSTNYFDEAASSAIHLTAANQFAEGEFPPRHNALPDVVIKYHYGFTILSGSVRWLTGLTANTSVDVASTFLWLFLFVFVVSWLRHVGLTRFAALWGGWATVLGGGLAWLYLPRIEAYSGVAKVPAPTEMVHQWAPASGWWGNLAMDARVPSLHLRNADGSLSHLPWDAAAQLQQHAVMVGAALTVFALALFVTWQRDGRGLRPPLLVANVVVFGLLPLAHAAFGAMAAVAAGLWLLGSWIVQRTRAAFFRGAIFAVGTGALTLLHGGLFARGPQYGGNAVATLRNTFGYAEGGVAGFIHWNIAGFGLPLAFALVGWALYRRVRDEITADQRTLFGVLTVLGAVAWGIPQVMFYSSDTIGAEQFTEISKFFFVARLAFALLSAFGAAWITRHVHWTALAPALPAMAIVPLAFAYAGSVGADGRWLGFYRAPYRPDSVEQQMGAALDSLKHGPRDVYFDASADERTHGYLGELLVYGGSVFTLTPSRYERTGIGYRLSEEVIAQRMIQNSRMARLEPRAAEDCRCSWYYMRPGVDLALSPLLVRARFDKLEAEEYFVRRHAVPPRALYEITKPTADLDAGIDEYIRPRVITQPSRTGAAELIFYHRAENRMLLDGASVPLPDRLANTSIQAYVGHFAGAQGASLLLARMTDTHFELGQRIEDLVERNAWAWSYLAAGSPAWRTEYELFYWDYDIPVIADIDGDGVDAHIAFRPRTSAWSMAPDAAQVVGPEVASADVPLPFGGRFLQGSRGDLGVWSLASGTVTLRTVDTGASVTFRWGGRPGDVLVPGDYDGDGMDEIAVWQATNQTWYWRHAPDGPIAQATFGTPTAVPLPADYDGDGRIDLAYWEPGAGRILVSFTQGRSVDRTIVVPQGTIPAFVNMN